MVKLKSEARRLNAKMNRLDRDVRLFELNLLRALLHELLAGSAADWSRNDEGIRARVVLAAADYGHVAAFQVA